MGAGMDPPAPPRTAPDPDAAVLALGAAVLAAIVAIDVALKDTVTLTPWVLIAPMFIAARGTVRETTIVAIAAFFTSLGLGGVNGTFGEAIHISHAALVAAGGALAVFGAGVRRRLAAERERTSELLDRERAERVRQEFASRASQLLEAPPDEASMLDEVAGLAVPDMADLCLIDLIEPDGTLAGVVVRSTDPHDADTALATRNHAPIDPAGEHPVAVAARTGRAALLAELPEEDLRRYAGSREHLEMMLRLDYRSAIVVPLSGR